LVAEAGWVADAGIFVDAAERQRKEEMFPGCHRDGGKGKW
jgi:hypothetical protein